MKKLKTQLGFTMIELLIVITILGILAVAVLSAINPIEQINRGRDTGSQSDAEQLLSAIDRYNAFQGYYPWQLNADELDTSIMVDEEGERIAASGNFDVGLPVMVSSDEVAAFWDDGEGDAGDCHILTRLSTGDEDNHPIYCRGAQEIKDSFVNRLLDEGTRELYVYNAGTSGGSTYVCFIPRSGAFETAASDRCGAGLPDDIGAAAVTFLCGPDGEGEGVPMSCLP
jgi:prepilin-type N-terminal cleavage/methylation domain-containing protein